MPTIEHRHLRSALEYAVLIAAEGQKRRPPLVFPKELKPLLSSPRLPASALGRVRRAVEGNAEYRRAIAAGAVPELVDEVGRLWLNGAEGWEARAAELIAEQEAEKQHGDLRRDLQRAEKRRVAAEQATARIQAELMQRDATLAEQSAELDELRADVMKANDALEEMRAELIDTRNEIRHARDREAAAVARADALAGRADDGSVEAGDAGSVGDGAVDADRVAAGREVADEARRRLAEAAAASREFTDHLESLLVPDVPARTDAGGPDAPRRQPIALPGGVISTSAVAARHLLAAGAAILVDGYNVAMLAWPDRSLQEQRDALIARAENLARRSGADITIVFDGSSVVGAHAAHRKSVRVVYSPEGTTADDVIRAEVDRLEPGAPVVVVTNDREIVADVKAAGANVIPSNAFIAAL